MVNIADWKPDTYEIEIGDMIVSIIDANTVLDGVDDDFHFHSVCEFQYINKNHVCIKTADGTYRAEPGNYMIIPPKQFHMTENQYEELSRYVFLFSISYSGKGKTEFSEYRYYNTILNNLDKIYVGQNRMVTECIEEIMSTGRNFVSVHKLKLLFGLLFVTIFEGFNVIENMEFEEKDIKPTENAHKQKMRGIIGDYISQYWKKADIVDSLAKILHISPRHVARVIREVFGTSLSELILEQRMYCAKELVMKTDTPVVGVAEDVGYSSYNTFYKAFKRYYGFSPESLRFNSDKNERSGC